MKTNKLREKSWTKKIAQKLVPKVYAQWEVDELKSQWKQEALKAIDKIDDSSIEVKQGDSYLKKGTVGTSGIVDKVTITTSDVKEKCKKALTDL